MGHYLSELEGDPYGWDALAKRDAEMEIKLANAIDVALSKRKLTVGQIVARVLYASSEFPTNRAENIIRQLEKEIK